jgi:hypothetical protein
MFSLQRVPVILCEKRLGQLHVVVGTHADGAVSSARLVGIISDEVEGPDTHVLLSLGIAHPPGSLGHLENEDERRDKAAEQNATAHDLDEAVADGEHEGFDVFPGVVGGLIMRWSCRADR